MLTHIHTSNETLRKIGLFSKCMNLLPDKSTLVKWVFCSKMRLSNLSRRFDVKLTLLNAVSVENASSSMNSMEFRFKSNVFKYRRSCRTKWCLLPPSKTRTKQKLTNQVAHSSLLIKIECVFMFGVTPAIPFTLKLSLSIIVISLLLKSKCSTRDDIPMFPLTKFCPLFKSKQQLIVRFYFSKSK